MAFNYLYPFQNQPTPFVGRTKNNISYGERWAGQEDVVLIGQLTGCEFDSLTFAQRYLLSGFSKDFQTIEIVQDNNSIQEFHNTIIESVDFDYNKYVKILNYTINFSCYPSGFFSGYYGILEPKDTWDYSEGPNGVLQMTHNVSARGINTSNENSDALSNAKNFVFGRTGFVNFISPTFIQNTRQSGILVSQNENINRLVGSYSITEVFNLDQAYPCDYGIFRYVLDTQQVQGGFNSVSIQGSLQGGFKDDFNLLRARFSGINFYNQLLYSIDSGLKINPSPINKTVTEDPYNRTISFNLNYNDNPYYEINTNYSLSIQSGDDLITVGVEGEISARGDLKNRWEKTVLFFENSFSPYPIANSGYVTYAGTGAQLDNNSVSESVTYDKFNGNISFNYSYQDKPFPVDSGFQKFDYTVSVNPPLRKITSQPLILATGGLSGSLYETTDLGYVSRGTISIGGQATPQRQVSGEDSLARTKNAINNVFYSISSGYSNIYLENYNLGYGNDDLVNFNCGWSYDGLDVLDNTGNYTGIINL